MIDHIFTDYRDAIIKTESGNEYLFRDGKISAPSLESFIGEDVLQVASIPSNRFGYFGICLQYSKDNSDPQLFYQTIDNLGEDLKVGNHLVLSLARLTENNSLGAITSRIVSIDYF